jgi:hypothetical protein
MKKWKKNGWGVFSSKNGFFSCFLLPPGDEFGQRRGGRNSPPAT